MLPGFCSPHTCAQRGPVSENGGHRGKRKERSYKIYFENMDTGIVCVDESAGMSPDDALKTPKSAAWKIKPPALSGNQRQRATPGLPHISYTRV